NKFKVGDRQLIYLAVEGKIAAMFVVGYNVNINTAEYMKKLEKHGISILVRTSDPNITEELIENYFDLPRSFVKIISPVAGEIFKEKYNKELPKSPCLIAHSGGIVSFFKAFSSVFVIEERLKLSKILQTVGIGISLIVMALLSLFSGISGAGIVQLFLFQLIWTPLVLLIPNFKKI
ncbi:MAG: hypothetical protein RR914_03905, partial [Oscillospiraceae bacterium]